MEAEQNLLMTCKGIYPSSCDLWVHVLQVLQVLTGKGTLAGTMNYITFFIYK